MESEGAGEIQFRIPNLSFPNLSPIFTFAFFASVAVKGVWLNAER